MHGLDSPEASVAVETNEGEEVAHHLENVLDVGRAGPAVETTRRLMQETQSQHVGVAPLVPEAETDDESTKDTGSDEVEEGDEEEDEEEDVEHDFDNPFHGMDEQFDMRGGIDAHELLKWADEAKLKDNAATTALTPPLREFGPQTVKPRRLDVDLKPLTAKNIGFVKKVHSIGAFGERGEAFYNQAMAASTYTRVGYSSSIVVCVICCRLELRLEDTATLHIESLDVLKAYRRRRMASQLLVWVLQQASSCGGNTSRIRDVSAMVPVSNTAAVALFRDAFGFKLLEESIHQGEARYSFIFRIGSDA